MRKLLDSPWQTLSIPFALTPIGQLHQSPPSPVPGDLGRCPSHQSHATLFFCLSCCSAATQFTPAPIFIYFYGVNPENLYLSGLEVKPLGVYSLELHQECTQVVCSNKEARKHLVRRHSRNGPWTHEYYFRFVCLRVLFF